MTRTVALGAVLCGALALAACAKPDTARPDSPVDNPPVDTTGAANATASANASANASGDAAGPVKTRIVLDVTGGAHAGHYEVSSTKTTCSYGLAGDGSWGNQYSETGKADNMLSSVQLIVPDAKGAANGTHDFRVTVGFGALLQGKDFTVNPPNEGSGTVTVKDQGTHGTVEIDGRTPDGVAVKGTITCDDVLRAG